jgi:general stress protein CsbA
MQSERGIVTALLTLQLVVWMGFLIHRSPRFPGSAWGGALGVSAALLMFVPLAYTIVKRSPWLRPRVIARVPLARLLEWHTYASIVGAILAILHSGHRFQSWVGITLTASMLVAILSGYMGRYFFRYVSIEVAGLQARLAALRATYEALARRSAPRPELANVLGPRSGSEARALVEAFALRSSDAIKRRFRAWLAIHIAASIAFYGLLGVHVWSGIQYGLRWFDY